tara:strand:- start:2685 stop:3656 length:972 start_codon:yes stop_codon:yes gene_type:complete
MNKNNLITIQCHCDTKEKISLLNKNIKILKKEKFKILVVSHIPVNQKIQDAVDYFIYDKSNPILHWPDRGMIHWMKIDFDKPYKAINILFDFGWTTINQILLAGNLGLSLNFDYYTFINYDIKLTDNIINRMKNPLSLMSSKVIDNRVEDKFRFPSFIFNIFSKKNLKRILPLFSKEKYINGYYNEKRKIILYRDAEQYFGDVIKNFHYKIFKDKVDELITLDEPDMLNYSQHKEFKILLQNDNTHPTVHPSPHSAKALIYNNTSNGFDFIVNDTILKITDEKKLIILPKIKKIGYMYNSNYVDLINDYKKSDYVNINYEELW